MTLKNEIIIEKLPSHIAIIMDGNGRWAKKKGNQRIFGHKNAVTAVRETVEGCAELGIKYLTLYAFSTENWNRPKNEVDALMSLLVNALNDELDRLHENNIRLGIIGDIDALPENVRTKLIESIEFTKNNNGMHLIIALSYSSRWEIVNAVKKIASDVKNNIILLNEINQDVFVKYLETRDIPDPELLIRTSGEIRISNFLLWQIAYTELYFCDILWPDFRKEHLYQAIINYQKRERRFGKTSEQLKTE
jgi:undecaprenyl diphosphate synthase